MFADKGYIREAVQDDANDNIIRLMVMKKPEAVKGFVLLPMRWVVEAIPPVRCVWGSRKAFWLDDSVSSFRA